jgi:hypothetical protein
MALSQVTVGLGMFKHSTQHNISDLWLRQQCLAAMARRVAFVLEGSRGDVQPSPGWSDVVWNHPNYVLRQAYNILSLMSLWCHADKLTETEMDQNLKLYSTTVTTRSKDEHPVVSCWGVHEGIRVSTHSIGLTLPCTARATTCQDVIKKGRHVAMELQEFDRFSRGSSQFLRIRCFLCIWIFTWTSRNTRHHPLLQHFSGGN